MTDGKNVVREENVYDFDGMIPAGISDDSDFMLSINDRTVYKHQDFDAWYNPGYGGYEQIDDCGDNNYTVCNHPKTLSAEKVESIKELIKESGILDIEAVEFAPVIDGDISIYYFSDGDRSNAIEGYNLWYYANHPETYAGRVLILEEEIKKIIYEE